jgi:hypothetical protein
MNEIKFFSAIRKSMDFWIQYEQEAKNANLYRKANFLNLLRDIFRTEGVSILNYVDLSQTRLVLSYDDRIFVIQLREKGEIPILNFWKSDLFIFLTKNFCTK